MKNILYLLVFVSGFCYSQNGFIEVEVRDTVKLNPIKILYNVTVDQSAFHQVELGKSYDPTEARNKTNSKLLEIENFLTIQNYSFYKIGESNYEITNNFSSWNSGFTVTIETVKQLEKLREGLKKYDFIKASIAKVEHLQNDDSEKKLFQKLLEKAKNKAITIGKFANLKVGKIIEVTENKELENLNFSFFDLVSKSRSGSFNSFNEIYSVKSKSIVVKFLAD